VDSWFFLSFPRSVVILIAGPEEAKNPAGESPPPDSDPFSDAEFGKNPGTPSRQFAAALNRRFKFDKGCEVFIRSRDETLSVAAMGVSYEIVRRLQLTAADSPSRSLV
jgi:hypothetical protein